MPTFYPSLTPDLTTWALSQPLFWTASAPLTGKHINVSPKGLTSASFSILSPNTAAYIDATGSGSETIAHVYENGRVTVLFISFETAPRIMRLFCKARVVEFDQREFGELVLRMQETAGAGAGAGDNKKIGVKGARAVVLLDIFKVQTSCGYGVPVLSPSPSENHIKSHFQDRNTLEHWASGKLEKDQLTSYQAEWNSYSLDGLPGLNAARRAGGERWLWVGNVKAWGRRVTGCWDVVAVGVAVGVVAGFLVSRGGAVR